MIKKIIFITILLFFNNSFADVPEGNALEDCSNLDRSFWDKGNPSIEAAWKGQPEYSEYIKPGVSQKERVKLQRKGISCIVNDVFGAYIKTASDRSKWGMQEKFDGYDLEVKSIFMDLFLKSIGGLLNEEKDRRAFNAQLFLFMGPIDSVSKGKAGGNAEKIARDIVLNFKFTKKGDSLVRELMHAAKSIDNADAWSRIGAILKAIP